MQSVTKQMLVLLQENRFIFILLNVVSLERDIKAKRQE